MEVNKDAFRLSVLKLDKEVQHAASFLFNVLTPAEQTVSSIRCSFAFLSDSDRQDEEKECLQTLGTSMSTASCRLVERAVGIYPKSLKQQLTAFITQFLATPDFSGSVLFDKVAITSDFVRRLNLSEIALFLFAFPAHETVWNARRRLIKGLLRGDQIHDCCVVTVLKDIILTDFLLSFYYKIQQVWVYRGWLIKLLVKKRILVSGGVLSPDSFFGHDKSVFTFAADHHPMNYNAWQYRRIVYSERWRSDYDIINYCDCLRREVDFAKHFFSTHNGDGSASVYLLSLLHYCSSAETEKSLDSISLWRELLIYTQQEVSRHYAKGHECIWHLRLGLLQWGLNNKEARSSWLLADELDWVSLFVDYPFQEGRNLSRLSPQENVRNAWVESSGTPGWTSYLACRYGLRLLQIALLSY